ncbi:MAG: protein kinase [Polyangiaceae bacterium]
MATLYPGSVFAQRYRVVRELAAGSMGMLYEVEHLETGRACALKVMLPGTSRSADLRQRFETEARATAAVRSDYVVQVFDAGVEPASDTPFFVMELLDGEDLERRLERGPLPVGVTLRLLRQMASALDKLHARGVLHRDLKPENIFLTETDIGELKVKLVDFGVARLFEDAGAVTSTKAVGTPLYMPPEQFKSSRRIAPAVDIYAVGLIAFAMLTGHHYFALERDHSTSFLSFLKGTCQGPKEPASQRAAKLGVRLPQTFDAWLFKTSHADPEQRYASAGEAVLALAEALGMASLGQPSSPFHAPPQLSDPHLLSPHPAPPSVPDTHGVQRPVIPAYPEIRASRPSLADATGPRKALKNPVELRAASTTGSVSVSNPLPTKPREPSRSASLLVGISIASLIVCVGAGIALFALGDDQTARSTVTPRESALATLPEPEATPPAAPETTTAIDEADLDLNSLPLADAAIAPSPAGASPTGATRSPSRSSEKTPAEKQSEKPPQKKKPVVEAPPNPYGD